MSYLNQNSLSKTLDNLNDAFLFGKKLDESEKLKAAAWLASRQGLKNSYAGMFAPTSFDFRNGVKLYTGEKLTTNASIGHILGEETCRILNILNINDDNIRKALTKANNNFKKFIKRAAELGYAVEINYNKKGTYCCGKCSVAYWRNLASQGIEKNTSILKSGLKYLKMYRNGEGRWRRFPFYYTLSALIELDLKSAREELKYASNVCEKALNNILRFKRTGIIYKRRKILLEKTLAYV